MPVDRPTFSESWYRVVNLRPRLRSSVQIHRQHYRGQTWYVVQDPANNQFYRLPPAAYHLVAMLDGRRTVGDVWRACNEELGDAAPTQGETIQLLGQLYGYNLIQAELPPDAESMFRRFRKRKTREVRGYLTNILFPRIPLIDPERFLNRWVGVVGWIFSPIGAILWVAMIATGIYFVAGHLDELIAQGKAVRVLSASNLPWLYLSAAVIKTFHEFGHAFACKRFGQKEKTGGEVHVMGIMFLVFTPLPYVDASSMWAFGSKWRRVIVGASGMLVELFLAAIAAVVWSQVAPGTVPHTIAYNVMFIASVSTVLFNGNFLLRFDGYYILSDILEIPNLWNRSREYIYYLVKRYVWGVRRARCPSQAAGEKAWLCSYGIASTIYRAFIVVRILMYVAGAVPLLGAILATVAVVAWVFVPLGKFVHYLLANAELTRVRTRAVATTAATVLVIAGLIGLIPLPDHTRAWAVVRAPKQSTIYVKTEGFLRSYLPSGSVVRLDAGPEEGRVLLRCENRELELSRRQSHADLLLYEARWRQARQDNEQAAAQALAKKIELKQRELERLDEKIAELVIRAPHEGQWFAPGLDRSRGRYLMAGDPAGVLVDLRDPLVETVIGQDEAARLFVEVADRVEMRLPGAPEQTFGGSIIAKVPAGQKVLPSPSLATTGGGEIALNPDEPKETAQPFFRVFVRPDEDRPFLRANQRVAVRFALPSKPLAVRWYRALLQLLQKRFGM